MGALSELDEFLLNPQVRTCSVTARGTSRNSNLESRETHEDHSTNDPCPEGMFFPHHSRPLSSPGTGTYPHVVTESDSHTVTGNYSHRYANSLQCMVLKKETAIKNGTVIYVHRNRSAHVTSFYSTLRTENSLICCLYFPSIANS